MLTQHSYRSRHLREFASPSRRLNSQLSAISASTLIIHGDVDPQPVEAVERIHDSIANSRLVILENGGHLPFVEKPEELFALLEGFLNRTSFTLSAVPMLFNRDEVEVWNSAGIAFDFARCAQADSQASISGLRIPALLDNR